MHLFNLCDCEYSLVWQHLVTIKIVLWIGHQLGGNEVKFSINYPKMVYYQKANFNHLWDDYKKSGDPDDIPF
ncbi:MAG: hypothetical protein ACKPCP_21765 [Sphaerospermopsis kisseleviana]